MAGILHRVVDRWSSTDQQESDELLVHCARAGCRPIREQPDRDVVSLHGVVRAITLRPVGEATALEAELYDGSGTVTLVWLGRRRIAGIDAGRELTATGRLSERGGARVLYNPRYTLDAA
ncbi:DNA-binding protein [Aeromicrobium camelliae]|uniref:DNA-binding protein n=1 Tax=Aeromicrobium camelliae TaxID=1538144 RepID=A0A3N6X2Z6_9ACTN|nr:OB-fold nucleic acid binding domain-containing protein [Aeromicrobium camelliae]RQN08495.1 DNA-binding protein [Aeromicrobium camelliae]